MQISPISPKKIENFQNNRQLYGPIWGKSGQAKDIKIDKSKKKNFLANIRGGVKTDFFPTNLFVYFFLC